MKRDGCSIDLQTCPSSSGWNCAGNEHFYKGDHQAAFGVYRNILASHPDSPPARYFYLAGVQMEQQKRYEEAFDYYRSSIETEPTFVDSYIELGGLLAKIGDNEGACKCIERALEFDPSDLRIFANLKALYTQLAQTEPQTYLPRKRQLDAEYPALVVQLEAVPGGHCGEIIRRQLKRAGREWR